jgi:hypothetical protein
LDPKRATVKEELAHLFDARGATPKLGDRSNVMANITVQLMGDPSPDLARIRVPDRAEAHSKHRRWSGRMRPTADFPRFAALFATPVEEATRFNAELVAAGRVSSHLGSAARMRFANASFDRVFSTGIVHFWADPVGQL